MPPIKPLMKHEKPKLHKSLQIRGHTHTNVLDATAVLCFREKREKTNITWPNGDYSRVSFYQRITYTLDRELSVGDPDTDVVNGISTPYVVSLSLFASPSWCPESQASSSSSPLIRLRRLLEASCRRSGSLELGISYHLLLFCWTRRLSVLPSFYFRVSQPT